MNNIPTPPSEVIARLKMAADLRDGIKIKCVQRCENRNAISVEHIAAMAGTFSYHIRCALNYCMNDFKEKKLRPLLEDFQYERLGRNSDFPLVRSIDKFKGMLIIKFTEQHFPSMEAYLAKIQPYMPTGAWASLFIELNNQDKHKSLIVVEESNIAQYIILGLNEKILHCGDRLAIVRDNGQITTMMLPCIAGPLNLIYSTDEKMYSFFIEKGESRIMLFDYIESTGAHATEVIKGFYEIVESL